MAECVNEPPPRARRWNVRGSVLGARRALNGVVQAVTRPWVGSGSSCVEWGGAGCDACWSGAVPYDSER